MLTPECASLVSLPVIESFQHIPEKRQFTFFATRLYLIADLERSLTGTCTMAIVMLATFHPEELPGVPPAKLFGLADVASYNDAWNAARRVMDNCISKYLTTNETMQGSGGGMNFRSQTGWSPIGKLHLAKIPVRPLLTLETLYRKQG